MEELIDYISVARVDKLLRDERILIGPFYNFQSVMISYRFIEISFARYVA